MKKLKIFAYMALLLVSPAVLAHPGDEHLADQLNRQIAAEPNSQQALIRRGSLFVRAKKFELAMEDFSRAQALGNPAAVFLPLGILFYDAGKFEQAAAQFDLYLDRYPHDIVALEMRAKTAREMGLSSLALKYFKTFLEQSPYANPGHYLAAAEVALVATSDEQANTAAALSVIDAGIDRLGVTPQLQLFAIERNLERGQFDAAIVRQQSLATSTGEGPQWHLQMAALFIKAGRSTDATLELLAANDKIKQRRRTAALIKLEKQAEQIQLALNHLSIQASAKR
jgi:tetratricopeptide (TPR) repeat protein